jgi:hypothetical protein
VSDVLEELAPAAGAVAVAAPDQGSVRRTTTAPQVWRRVRAPLILAAVVLLTALISAVFTQRAKAGMLDPDAADAGGARALSQLLKDRSIDVTRVRGLPSQLRGVVFVPFADSLSESELLRVTAPIDFSVVLAGMTPPTVYDLPVSNRGESTRRAVPPACELPAAVAAGTAEMGGQEFSVVTGGTGVRVFACYPVGEGSTLLRVEKEGGSVTVLGSAAAFTNEHLANDGNAALALGVLDQGRPVTWVMPRAAGTAPVDEQKGLLDLLPDRVYLALLQVLVAVIVAMMWRGRRLGPVVTEPLPVVVRAAEAVEGRGRLYAAAKARGGAARQLRAGARARLGALMRLPQEAEPSVLVEGIASRTARPAEQINALLYGPDPVDDAALTRLADDLDSLDSEVRHS